jgi:hypothetical protein
VSTPRIQSDHSRVLWDSMLDADMNVLYWTYKCAREQLWTKTLKIIVLLTTSGAAVASLSIWKSYPTVWQLIATSAFIASVINQACFPPDRVAKLSGLIATWKELSIDYGLLWEKGVTLADTGGWDEFEAIKRREKTIDESEFPKIKSKLLEEAFRQVCRKRGLA